MDKAEDGRYDYLRRRRREFGVEGGARARGDGRRRRPRAAAGAADDPPLARHYKRVRGGELSETHLRGPGVRGEAAAAAPELQRRLVPGLEAALTSITGVCSCAASAASWSSVQSQRLTPRRRVRRRLGG